MLTSFKAKTSWILHEMTTNEKTENSEKFHSMAQRQADGLQ